MPVYCNFFCCPAFKTFSPLVCVRFGGSCNLVIFLLFTELQEIEAAKSWPCRGGGLPKTLRFDPFMSQTSGLFLAKFKKLMT